MTSSPVTISPVRRSWRAAPATPDPPLVIPRREPVLRLVATRAGLILTAGLLLGGLTSWGQTVLPAAVAPFANSASGWTIVAVLLLWRIRGGPAASAFYGALAFSGLDLGYAMVSTARGYFYDPTFWLVVALTAGPVVGAAVSLARGRASILAAAGCGVLLGLVAGDGIYGLAVVAGSTGPVYWTAAVVAALAGLIASTWRLRSAPRGLVVLWGTGILVAAVYPSGLLLLGSLM
ncbi:DUF6518 family protein [Amnibacterium flavum]|uniref:Uncharacterized protein n=1 Tax=Amnibacterium flavum TaxID=2173173 RepID=A0A2V1HPN6_9MICO|nr:DUF6518 family protein [Amnibacterium flavum]PVZ93572.1 hypothetical protein DDQ50_14765 [Amnibacterium flavum]